MATQDVEMSFKVCDSKEAFRSFAGEVCGQPPITFARSTE